MQPFKLKYRQETGNRSLSRKKRRKKSRLIKLVEYSAAYLIILITRAAPLKAVKAISNFLGDLLYFSSKKRRNIAVENLRHAFKKEKDESEIRKIARQSCRSLFFTFLENVKLRVLFAKANSADDIWAGNKELYNISLKAKKMHDESGGCIFVTPHVGNWEILPHLSAAIDIPIVIVARPLDNEYLHRLIFESRSHSGQVIIPKKDALFALQKALKQNKSIGLLPDQSTMKGLLVDFFGRKATTTPVPALLAVAYKRPIVVLACCRRPGNYQYEGFVSGPIYPGEYTSKKDEIIRITQEMNKRMEDIIRKYPKQYLWMHNRWKTYKGKKEFLAQE